MIFHSYVSLPEGKHIVDVGVSENGLELYPQRTPWFCNKMTGSNFKTSGAHTKIWSTKNPRKNTRFNNKQFGGGLYTPSMMILGTHYYQVYHSK